MNDQLNLPEVESELGDEETELEGADEGDSTVAPFDSVVLDKNDRSLSEFHRWYTSGKLRIDPEWQRRYVWDTKRAAKLIESFLKDIPVPVIYLSKSEEGKYEVIDGLQRLSSVFKYFENDFSLQSLDLAPEYNGKHYRDLPENIQNRLQDATLRTFELSPKTPKDLMFVIFERLNTGGIALNDMEIRNCLYRGKLNDLIKQLAQNSDFVTCANQRKLEKRMDDRALVLRYLAFYEKTYHKAKQGLKKFINEFLQTYHNLNEEKAKEFEKQFSKVMKACITVFGNKGFRLRRENTNGGGEWASRINATVFQIVAVSFAEYDLGQITRRADSILEEYIDLVTFDEKWKDCVRRATGEVTRMQYAFQTWNERLKLAIGNEPANDKIRCFSHELKEIMFKQNATCEICGQKINLIIDSALDHDLHYWRGGKTVPENARLVHRQCNLTRSR